MQSHLNVRVYIHQLAVGDPRRRCKIGLNTITAEHETDTTGFPIYPALKYIGFPLSLILYPKDTSPARGEGIFSGLFDAGSII